jgi:hypothetical protein
MFTPLHERCDEQKPPPVACHAPATRAHLRPPLLERGIRYDQKKLVVQVLLEKLKMQKEKDSHDWMYV